MLVLHLIGLFGSDEKLVTQKAELEELQTSIAEDMSYRDRTLPSPKADNAERMLLEMLQVKQSQLETAVTNHPTVQVAAQALGTAVVVPVGTKKMPLAAATLAGLAWGAF